MVRDGGKSFVDLKAVNVNVDVLVVVNGFCGVIPMVLALRPAARGRPKPRLQGEDRLVCIARSSPSLSATTGKVGIVRFQLLRIWQRHHMDGRVPKIHAVRGRFAKSRPRRQARDTWVPGPGEKEIIQLVENPPSGSSFNDINWLSGIASCWKNHFSRKNRG